MSWNNHQNSQTLTEQQRATIRQEVACSQSLKIARDIIKDSWKLSMSLHRRE